MRRRSLTLSIAVATAVLAGPGAGAAGAETCNGTLSGERDLDSLVVPDRGNCTIAPNADVTVGGKVDVGANARLSVRRLIAVSSVCRSSKRCRTAGSTSVGTRASVPAALTGSWPL